MNYSISRIKAVACVLAATAVMSGCSLLPGRGSSSGGFSSRDKKHSDKYRSAEEYCEYWFGPFNSQGVIYCKEFTGIRCAFWVRSEK